MDSVHVVLELDNYYLVTQTFDKEAFIFSIALTSENFWGSVGLN
jgi:hypothetical protein